VPAPAETRPTKVRPVAAPGRCRRRSGFPRWWRLRSGSRAPRARRGCVYIPRWGSRWQTQDQGAQASGDGWSTGPDGLGGPAADDQFVVPAQDGGRGSRVRAVIRARSVQRIRGRGLRRRSTASWWRRTRISMSFGGVGSGVQHDPAEERGEHLVDQSQPISGSCHHLPRTNGHVTGCVHSFGHPQARTRSELGTRLGCHPDAFTGITGVQRAQDFE